VEAIELGLTAALGRILFPNVGYRTDFASVFCSDIARTVGTSGSGGAMVTPDEMRLFALECLRWSEETGNASHRDLMVQVARQWMATASAIERRVMNGAQLAAPDLRHRLD
jgi:hypothetical protein